LPDPSQNFGVAVLRNTRVDRAQHTAAGIPRGLPMLVRELLSPSAIAPRKIASEIRDEIRGSKIADSGVQLDELSDRSRRDGRRDRGPREPTGGNGSARGRVRGGVG
jgi:hypothetical protein